MENELKGLLRLCNFSNKEGYNDAHLLILINRKKHLISQLNKPTNSIKVTDTNLIHLSSR